VGETDDYLTGLAKAERERQIMEHGRRRSEAHEDARHEQSMAFEANKHMTTLSLSALVLTTALSQLAVVDVPLMPFGLVIFGVPLISSLGGMMTASLPLPPAKQQGMTRPATLALGLFIVSSVLFVIGVLAVAMLASVEGPPSGG
jgi:hypothetical protein